MEGVAGVVVVVASAQKVHVRARCEERSKVVTSTPIAVQWAPPTMIELGCSSAGSRRELEIVCEAGIGMTGADCGGDERRAGIGSGGVG